MGSWTEGPSKGQAALVEKAQKAAALKVAEVQKKIFGTKKVLTWKKLQAALDKESDDSKHNLSNTRGMREFFLGEGFCKSEHLAKPAAPKKEKKKKDKKDDDKKEEVKTGEEGKKDE